MPSGCEMGGGRGWDLSCEYTLCAYPRGWGGGGEKNESERNVEFGFHLSLVEEALVTVVVQDRMLRQHMRMSVALFDTACKIALAWIFTEFV